MIFNPENSVAKIVGNCKNYPNANYFQDGHYYFDTFGECLCCEEEQIEPEPTEQEPEQEEPGQTEPEPTKPEPEEDHHITASEAIDTIQDNADPQMTLSDEELNDLASQGMAPLRQYAEQFGIKGISKDTIINELKAMR